MKIEDSVNDILAIKCMAMRIDAGSIDESTAIKDIRSLVAEASIYDAETALNVVSEFYPKNSVESATQFSLEETAYPVSSGSTISGTALRLRTSKTDPFAACRS